MAIYCAHPLNPFNPWLAFTDKKNRVEVYIEPETTIEDPAGSGASHGRAFWNCRLVRRAQGIRDDGTGGLCLFRLVAVPRGHHGPHEGAAGGRLVFIINYYGG